MQSQSTDGLRIENADINSDTEEPLDYQARAAFILSCVGCILTHRESAFRNKIATRVPGNERPNPQTAASCEFAFLRLNRYGDAVGQRLRTH